MAPIGSERARSRSRSPSPPPSTHRQPLPIVMEGYVNVTPASVSRRGAMSYHSVTVPPNTGRGRADYGNYGEMRLVDDLSQEEHRQMRSQSPQGRGRYY